MSAPISITKMNVQTYHRTQSLSSSYPPYKNKNLNYSFYNKPKLSSNKHTRRCSYVIASVDKQTFINQGARTLIEDCIYIIKRKYDGTSKGETNAIVGINKKFIQDLFYTDCFIYETLKLDEQLQDVPGINDLSPYKLSALKYLLKFLYFIHDDELVIFNIEPKGDGKYYPSANLCLPGGGLESQDNFCHERCAWREFEEETGLKIPPLNSENIKLITKQKLFLYECYAMYFIVKIKNFLS